MSVSGSTFRKIDFCEVHYETGIDLGYRFRRGYVLTAGRTREMARPKFIVLGDRNLPARALASRTENLVTVTLIAIEGDTVSPEQLPIFEVPLDFSPAKACWNEREMTGYFLRSTFFQSFNYVVEGDKVNVPIGAPVFLDVGFVGFVSRHQALSERLLLTAQKLLELTFSRAKGKQIARRTRTPAGGLFLTVMRIPRSQVFQLWSLHELAKDILFTKFLLEDKTNPAAAPSKELRSSEQPRSVPIQTVFGQARSIDHQEIVLERSSRNIWLPLERTPRMLPLGPRSRTALVASFVLIALGVLSLTASEITTLNLPSSQNKMAPKATQ